MDWPAALRDLGKHEIRAARSYTEYQRDKSKAEVDQSHVLLQGEWLATHQHCQNDPEGPARQPE